MDQQPELFVSKIHSSDSVEPSDLLKTLQQHIVHWKSIEKLLKGATQLLEANPAKALRALDNVTKVIEKLNLDVSLQTEVEEYVDAARSAIERQIERRGRSFGAQLEEELRPLSLKLTGQQPELKAGWFTIVIDFRSSSTKILWGPTSDVLAKPKKFSPAAVAAALQQIQQSLGARLSETDLLDRMRQAYERVGGQGKMSVPLVAVLAEMAVLIQQPKWRADPRLENYTSYRRSDFGYDLFRLNRFLRENSGGPRLTLDVATRAETRKTSDYVWVPENDRGAGSRYARMTLTES